MKKYFLLNNKKVYCEESIIPPSNQVINKKIMRENLFKLEKIFKKKNIFHGLIFGTLLGAIREKDFIGHDKDADIYFLEEDKEKVLDLIKNFKKEGFGIIRIERNLMSVIRKGNYIDFYFFKKNKKYRICSYYKFKCHLLENVMDYNFLGIDLKIPINYKILLVKMYGKNWKTPIINKPASSPLKKVHDEIIHLIPIKIRKKVRNNFKKIYFMFKK